MSCRHIYELIKVTRETPKGQKSPIQKFIEYQKTIKKKYKNVVVITNNPCLEFWFLLHFQRTSRVFGTCTRVENQLKSHLKGYEKTQKYYTKQDNDIYTKLKPYLKKAIDNACSLGHFDSDEPYKALSEMYLFFGSEEMKKHF
ncbi:RloB domain-containing protein [Thermophagus sp. OGC60D27]|uniref:RloB domain-containing protein n=1 Tax=Thermophagus sp. OGC60D27 TaxID=3458415 RepID=UPI004037B75E